MSVTAARGFRAAGVAAGIKARGAQDLALVVNDGPAKAAATAVLTTDTFPKQATVTGAGWTVGGFAKGAGMVAPSLATMLSVLTTDLSPGYVDENSAYSS